MAILGREEYRDKVYACWLGKNCGGTLGAPLEGLFGREEPFDVAWYPELRPGGIPNDDLELQLILLKAVEEVGFALTARDLAQYWLDHVGYNFDEYGLHKTNLRLGLLPPVSGHYNNWFQDCMGAPIRSEIWACMAPGSPALAVQYAREDASVDHAGGEGVWGEVFNAAVESAAFVEQNAQALLDIGLSYIPPRCATAQAVRAARAAHRDGAGWREARHRVMAAVPHHVAQYAPLNIGFQIIGWLYGAGFGDALCTAVNCGYDTDCTGASLGALLGIVGGRAGLPSRWTAPLGEEIVTNESWGGLTNVSDGPHPIPRTLAELTERVCRLGPRLLALSGTDLQIGERTDLRELQRERLVAPRDLAARLEGADPLRLRRDLGAIGVEIDYGAAPVIVPGEGREVHVYLHNKRAGEVVVDIALEPPAGWLVTPGGPQRVDLPVHGSGVCHFAVRVERPDLVENSNRLMLSAQPRGRPAEPSVPVVLVGARRWLVWQAQEAGEARALLARRYPPEDQVEAEHVPARAPAPDSGWQSVSSPDNAVPTALGTDWTGVLYAWLFTWSAHAREVCLGVPATCPRRVWLNGQALHEVGTYTLLRPNYGHGGGDGISYRATEVQAGWNSILVKYTREAGAPPFAAHLTLSTADLFRGLTDMRWTRYPWEEG